MTAVQNRPEAYQAGLNNLNSINDLKRSIIKTFPKVTGFWRTTHDKDKYILNKDWNDVGMMVYFDLLEFLSGMGESRASRAKTEKSDREVGAVALGITSQVRIASLKSLHAITQLNNAEVSVAGAQKVYQTAKRTYAASASDKLSADEANANYLGESISRMRARGEANAMLAELYAAMGTNYTEPIPRD
jgi:outer membrane protein TolC